MRHITTTIFVYPSLTVSTVIKKKFIRYYSTTNELVSFNESFNMEEDFLASLQPTEIKPVTKNIPIFVEIIQDQSLTDMNKALLREITLFAKETEKDNASYMFIIYFYCKPQRSFKMISPYVVCENNTNKDIIENFIKKVDNFSKEINADIENYQLEAFENLHIKTFREFLNKRTEMLKKKDLILSATDKVERSYDKEMIARLPSIVLQVFSYLKKKMLFSANYVVDSNNIRQFAINSTTKKTLFDSGIFINCSQEAILNLIDLKRNLYNINKGKHVKKKKAKKKVSSKEVKQELTEETTLCEI